MTKSMKAVRIHEYGGLDVLTYEEAPRPEPNEDEVLIRILAAGVHPDPRYGEVVLRLGRRLHRESRELAGAHSAEPSGKARRDCARRAVSGGA